MSSILSGQEKIACPPPADANHPELSARLRGHLNAIRPHAGRAARRSLLFAIDAASLTLASYLAFALLFGSVPSGASGSAMLTHAVLPRVTVCLIAMFGAGVYRIWSRDTGLRDARTIAAALAIGGTLSAVGLAVTRMEGVPARLLLIAWFLDCFAVLGSRLAYRMFMERRAAKDVEHQGRPRAILIVGAGKVGASLARELHRRSADGIHLIGFVDDAPHLRHTRIDGTPVLGTTADLRHLIAQKSVDTVIVAMSSPGSALLRMVNKECEGLRVRLQTARGVSGVRSGNGLHATRDVRLEDLLPRRRVAEGDEPTAGYLFGERVLITGAGGSIGSELVRQVVAGKPAQIILLGHGENSVFEIQQELKREWDIAPVCLIADIRDSERIGNLFRKHRPTVVFHAAAHKHVTLMEGNLEEAVTNNVLGTRNLVRAAAACNARRFVMISTDKAVNPTSIMGVSKRIAEMVAQHESRRTDMEIAMVRFGNVLGSRGSVVPLMQKQIQAGGPVTVTHPDVMRYFMTIPEAVHLVLQAGALGGRGKIYMLDMGEPIRILDLANDLIRLSGLMPNRDVMVEITGLKPGEKLFEELLTSEEDATKTRNERIYIARPPNVTSLTFEADVDALIAAAQAGESISVLRHIQHLVPTFKAGLTHTVTETSADTVGMQSRRNAAREDLAAVKAA